MNKSFSVSVLQWLLRFSSTKNQILRMSHLSFYQELSSCPASLGVFRKCYLLVAIGLGALPPVGLSLSKLQSVTFHVVKTVRCLKGSVVSYMDAARFLAVKDRQVQFLSDLKSYKDSYTQRNFSVLGFTRGDFDMSSLLIFHRQYLSSNSCPRPTLRLVQLAAILLH